MKRLLSVFALSAVLAVSLSFAALAQEGQGMGMKKGESMKKDDAPKTMTVTGEIVDMGCYMGHGAKGQAHKECALKCIANGMPMGLLTSDGTLYVLTMSHSDADPYNNAKKMAADMVAITGPVSERSGIKSLEVDKVETAKTDKGE
jgi:hypothetical protein